MPPNFKADVEKAQSELDFKQHKYQLELNTTLGRISLDLFPDLAPGHVKNLLALTKLGFYDGLTFHRVIRGFMIQGGCPLDTGSGGPGYTIAAEFNPTKHEPGVLSMARTSDPNSAGSQFFICLEKVPHLDGKYTAFGKTADAASLGVVRAIGEVPTGPNDRPEEPVEITSAKVIETALAKG